MGQSMALGSIKDHNFMKTILSKVFCNSILAGLASILSTFLYEASIGFLLT